jgi:site-specific recombinase XerD
MERTTVMPDIVALTPSFNRHMRAEAHSERTIAIYGYGLRDLVAFLHHTGIPTGGASITREHIELWLVDIQQRRSQGTARAYFKGVQQFFRWLEEDEGEITRSPMARMHPPKVALNPPPILHPDQIRALLKACDGQDFEERRDTAMIRVMYDTGCRLGELAGVRLGHEGDSDLDLDHRAMRVTGKGNRVRWLPLGAKAIKALDRYLRVRSRHPHADEPWLWLGRKGRMRESGIQQMLRRRGTQAGVGPINPHLFRHTFSHEWRVAGGDRDDLKAIGGWQSDQMLARYGASAAMTRAHSAHKTYSPGDRL